MEKYLKHIPLAFFGLSIGKLLIFPATWEGAACAFVAAILAAFYEYKNQDTQIKELQKTVTAVEIAVNNQAKAIENAQSGVSALKLATSMRTPTSTPSTQRIF